MSYFIKFKKISIILIATLLLPIFALSVGASEKPNTPDMEFDCESVILMEARTGTVLYEKNADKALPPASVTKIMTLLLVMEEIEKGKMNYSDTIVASANAASMGGSQIFLKEGEEMSALDLIKSVIIASANDAAVALAEHVAGSETAFVALMNERASELGMKNTNFENTNGLDDTTTNHVTSARDIAIMSRELIKHEDVLKYSSTWMDSVRGGAFGLTNTNRLVRFYQGITGLKTGSTAKAKFCVSATAKRGNMHLICVVMGAPSSDVRNSIASQLLNYGFANYELFEDHAEPLDPIKINMGVESRCNIQSSDFYCVVPKGAANKMTKQYILPESVNAPISTCDIIGRIEYKLNGKIMGATSIFASNTVPKIDYWTLFSHILSKFLLK